MLRLQKSSLTFFIAIGVLLALNAVYDHVKWVRLRESYSNLQEKFQVLRGSAREYQTTSANTAWSDNESTSALGRSKIGKVSMLYGNPNPLYERALALNKPHNDHFGYSHFVLRSQTLPDFWSKPGYILQLLLAELAKPEADRLEWLLWLDGDTVVMNPNIPLEIFLPPSANDTLTDWSHIHAVVTNDHRGLNNGVFFLKVHPWSVALMTATLSTPDTHPEVDLIYNDQTALMYWANQPKFRESIIHVPQRWFNAYAGFRGSAQGTDGNEVLAFSDPLQPTLPGKVRHNSVKEGDFLVHLAGHPSQRAQRMEPWVSAAEQHLPTWELELDQTTYLREIASFWVNDAQNERATVDKVNSRLEALRQAQNVTQQNVVKKPQIPVKQKNAEKAISEAVNMIRRRKIVQKP